MMPYETETDKMFVRDIQEKKRAGRGAYAMKGKGKRGGIKGGMKTEYDYMTTKEKKNLIGEVKIVKIMNYEAFRKMPLENQKQLMEGYLLTMTNAKLEKEWGLNSYSYLKLKRELGLPVNSPKAKKEKDAAAAAATQKDQKKDQQQEQKVQLVFEQPKPAPIVQQVVAPTKSKGIHLEANGEYSAAFGAKLLENFTMMVLELDGEFEFEISIRKKEVAQ